MCWAIPTEWLEPRKNRGIMNLTSWRSGPSKLLFYHPSAAHPPVFVNKQIQKGLSVLSQGLDFCHSNAKLIHGDLNPRSIFVNVKVCGKLGISENFCFLNIIPPLCVCRVTGRLAPLPSQLQWVRLCSRASIPPCHLIASRISTFWV